MSELKSKKKFLVVGLGAIGQMTACRLKASGNTVYGLDVSKRTIEAIREEGITMEGIMSSHAMLDGLVSGVDELTERQFDYVLICVKTPYMEAVAKELKKLENGFQIVSMQNGIDTEDFFAEHFEKERVMRMVINFAGNLRRPNNIKMIFFHKPNYLGCLCESNFDKAQELAEIFGNSRLDTEVTREIKKLTYRKAILVAALAPIAALLGMTMVEVMTLSETRYMVEMLLEEAVEVARAKGYDYGPDFIKYCLNYLTSAGRHKPSMLIDIEEGNPTEIEFINGKISFHGHNADIPVYLNTYLTLLVKAKEKQQIKRKRGESIV